MLVLNTDHVQVINDSVKQLLCLFLNQNHLIKFSDISLNVKYLKTRQDK